MNKFHIQSHHHRSIIEKIIIRGKEMQGILQNQNYSTLVLHCIGTGTYGEATQKMSSMLLHYYGF